MRKIKQGARSYLIHRYGLVGWVLFDSHRTFSAARAFIGQRIRSHRDEQLRIYESGRLLFCFDGTQPCKNSGNATVGQTGECLRCGADQGEACR